MLKTTLATAIIAAGVLGLSGCDVKKTQEGHVTLPKYDVTTPDVKVGSEKKTIDVPTVDVKTAREKEQEQAARQMGAASSTNK